MSRSLRAISLQYVLPLAQMIVAVLLRWHDYVWFKRMAGFPPPGWELSTAVNIPVALIRALWVQIGGLWGRWDDALYVAAVGLLWYWVALNVQSWRRNRTVRHFSNRPLRITADLLLIAMGIIFGCVVAFHDLDLSGYANLRRWYWTHLRSPATWLWLSIVVLHSLWALSLLFFFGRDLICVWRLGGGTSSAQPNLALKIIQPASRRDRSTQL